jgi:hypothetical protein
MVLKLLVAIDMIISGDSNATTKTESFIDTSLMGGYPSTLHQLWEEEVTVNARAAFWASDPAWTPPSEGGAVTAWPDRGTEGKDAVEKIRDPLTYTSNGINGKPAIVGNGTDQGLHTNQWDSPLEQPFTIIAVAAAGSTNGYITDGYGLGSRQVLYRVAPGEWAYYAGSTASGGTSNTDPQIFVVSVKSPECLMIVGNELAFFGGDAGDHPMEGISFLSKFNGGGSGNCHTGPIAFYAVFEGDINEDIYVAFLVLALNNALSDYYNLEGFDY